MNKFERGDRRYGTRQNKSGRDMIRDLIKAGKSDEEIIKEMTTGNDPYSRLQVETILEELKG